VFVDRIVFSVQAGKGGDGAVAWRREKFVRKGGPTGGDGGRGASVWIEADDQLISLQSYRHRRRVDAQHGQKGSGAGKTGAGGEDLTLKVPVGTLVKDGQTGKVLCDLTQHGQRFCAAKGGVGGRGNRSFRSATHQSPYEATPGTMGEIRAIELELKLIADVGFVGLPNAGKSTLLVTAAGAPARIGAYPFTTLVPNLGYVESGWRKLLLADIPGIIDGAHENRGLGLAFLRHIIRTHLLVYVIDASGFEGHHPWEDWCVLRRELAAYDEALLRKPSIVVLNKMDLEGAAENAADFRERLGGQTPAIPVIEMVAQRAEGVELFREMLVASFEKLEQADRQPQPVEQS
jgi:GTP-binding protein